MSKLKPQRPSTAQSTRQDKGSELPKAQETQGGRPAQMHTKAKGSKRERSKSDGEQIIFGIKLPKVYHEVLKGISRKIATEHYQGNGVYHRSSQNVPSALTSRIQSCLYEEISLKQDPVPTSHTNCANAKNHAENCPFSPNSPNFRSATTKTSTKGIVKWKSGKRKVKSHEGSAQANQNERRLNSGKYKDVSITKLSKELIKDNLRQQKFGCHL
jgi:hypothetical protein